MQLRLLQTVVDVAAEKNSTLVMPFPVELLRFFEKATATGDADAAKIPDGDLPQAVPDSGNLPDEDVLPDSEPIRESDDLDAPQSAPGLSPL